MVFTLRCSPEMSCGWSRCVSERSPNLRRALDLIKKSGTQVLLVLNKIDRVNDKSDLLPLLEKYRAAHDFVEYFPVSALKNAGLDELRSAILARLPQGPAYFPADHITDQPERFLATELIREKIILE